MDPKEIQNKMRAIQTGKSKEEAIPWKEIGSLSLLDEFNKLADHGVSVTFDGDRNSVILTKRKEK